MTTTNEDADELRAGFIDDEGWGGHLGWWGLGATCEVDEVQE